MLAVEPTARARVLRRAAATDRSASQAVEWAAPFIDDDERRREADERRGRPCSPATSCSFRTRRGRQLGGSRRSPRCKARSSSVDPQDGAVVALTGGFDFFLSNYNRAVQAQAPAGSAFKPFVYSAALANGFTPATIINDAPPDVGYQAELERVWRPANFGDKYYGLVRLRFALRNR